MSKPDHLLSHQILTDSVVSCSVVAQHNLVERLLGFTAKGAMVVSGVHWFAAAPTEVCGRVSLGLVLTAWFSNNSLNIRDGIP